MNTILFLGKLKRKTTEDYVNVFSAQAAFFIILSIIPFFLLLLTSIQMINIDEAIIQDVLKDLIVTGDDYTWSIYLTLAKIIKEVYSQSAAIIPITAVTALWSAAKAVMAITGGLNSVYDVEEDRNYIVLRIRAAFYTVLLVLVLALALVLLVFGDQIHIFFSRYIPIIANITAVIISIRTVTTLAVMVVFFTFLYKYLPNRKAPLLTQVPGALFTAVGWSVFSFGFSMYLTMSNGFDMYGSLTAIVLVMFWLYACMYIMLLGGEINVALNDRVIDMSRRRKEKRERRKGK